MVILSIANMTNTWCWGFNSEVEWVKLHVCYHSIPNNISLFYADFVCGHLLNSCTAALNISEYAAGAFDNILSKNNLCMNYVKCLFVSMIKTKLKAGSWMDDMANCKGN